ncbi:MAG: DEAD/DEAH box helicase [Rhodothermales bacterium]
MAAYVKVFDLTSKPRGDQSADSDLLKEPDPPLPEITIDDLPSPLRNAVARLGWPSLMPVQRKAIPYLLAGRDVIVQSKTGSGKTGAFLLPLIEKLDKDIAATQTLILTPTRELARQIFAAFDEAIDKESGLRSVAVYGGVGYGPQIKAFREGAQVVVGTPGRVLDHIERGTLRLDKLRVLILDEADEMLSVGFYPAMKQLQRSLPPKRESYMFSATMPYKVQMLGEEFLHKPGFLSLGRVSVDKMEHRYTVVAPMSKNQALVRYIELENPESAIVFANTKRRVEYLSGFLRNYGFDAMGLSGDLSQKERDRVMGEIQSGKLRFLVATDVAARGIDISDLSHILMFDVPQDPEYYVHRAGRTARAGKEGVVITLATITDEHVLKSISRKFELQMEREEAPVQEAVEMHVSERLIELLEARFRVMSDEEKEYAHQYLPIVSDLMAEGLIHPLAMLLDLFYHDTLHVRPELHAAISRPSAPPNEDELKADLKRHLESLSNLNRDRLERFVPLVKQFIEEGEPEIPALLLADFHARASNPPDRQSQRTQEHNPARRKPRSKR